MARLAGLPAAGDRARADDPPGSRSGRAARRRGRSRARRRRATASSRSPSSRKRSPRAAAEAKDPRRAAPSRLQCDDPPRCPDLARPRARRSRPARAATTARRDPLEAHRTRTPHRAPARLPAAAGRGRATAGTRRRARRPDAGRTRGTRGSWSSSRATSSCRGPDSCASRRTRRRVGPSGSTSTCRASGSALRYDRGIPVGDGLLRGVRLGQNTLRTTRIVIDLERYDHHRVFTLASPARIVIDVFGESEERPSAKIRAGDCRRDCAASRRSSSIRVTAAPIPGATGIAGLREKDVNLVIGQLRREAPRGARLRGRPHAGRRPDAQPRGADGDRRIRGRRRLRLDPRQRLGPGEGPRHRDLHPRPQSRAPQPRRRRPRERHPRLEARSAPARAGDAPRRRGRQPLREARRSRPFERDPRRPLAGSDAAGSRREEGALLRALHVEHVLAARRDGLRHQSRRRDAAAERPLSAGPGGADRRGHRALPPAGRARAGFPRLPGRLASPGAAPRVR